MSSTKHNANILITVEGWEGELNEVCRALSQREGRGKMELTVSYAD